MEYKKMNMGTYNLHLVKTDKFKMCHVEVIFRNNFDKKTITKRQFLTKILCEVNNDYQSRRKMLLKFEDLYNASIYGYTSRVGSSVISNFCADFLNPEFTENAMPKETIKLLFDDLFNPFVRTKEFDNKTFEIIKNRVRDSFKEIDENPAKLSAINALKLLGDTPASCSALGMESDLDDITPDNLYDYYLDMIKNDYIDIFVVGNLDMDEVSKYINEYAKFKIIKNHDVSMYSVVPKMKEKIVLDNSNNLQSHVVLLLTFKNLTTYEKRYVLNLYNMILGGGSLQTKLYKKLREENSLCYTVSSYYQKYDSLIMITTGTSVENSDKAIKLIKLSLKNMTNSISDVEIENAKKIIITSLNAINDNVDRLTSNLYFQDLNELDSVEQRIKTFKEVTIKDIYNLSKKMNIAVTYTLEGNEK